MMAAQYSMTHLHSVDIIHRVPGVKCFRPVETTNLTSTCCIHMLLVYLFRIRIQLSIYDISQVTCPSYCNDFKLYLLLLAKSSEKNGNRRQRSIYSGKADQMPIRWHIQSSFISTRYPLSIVLLFMFRYRINLCGTSTWRIESVGNPLLG